MPAAPSPFDANKFIHAAQVGGIESYEIADGAGRGVRALCVNTGGNVGLDCDGDPDRSRALGTAPARSPGLPWACDGSDSACDADAFLIAAAFLRRGVMVFGNVRDRVGPSAPRGPARAGTR